MKLIDRTVNFLVSRLSNTRIVGEYYKRNTTGKRIDYKRQPALMSRKDIKDWRNALLSATDPDNPRRGDLMRFYENMKLDGHLMSCVENRTLPVQCAPFKLIDKDDNEDYEAKKLLEKPWFLELARLICSHTFEGTKVICMYEIDENGEVKQVEEVPQTNFIPQDGVILINEYDTDGISYRRGVYKNYYFQVGGDWNLGLFCQLSMVIIAKKLGLGSWMSYIDKYGVPPIFAITERMDAARRDELFEMLENFRMNHFAVLQGNEKIETPQGYNVDAHNTFKSLMSDICDKEISKRIQGSSGLTDEKSFVGAAEVQERILGYRHKVDKLIFKYFFNTEVKPRLVRLSPVYAPLENLTLEYDDSESLTMKELLQTVRDLSAYFEFDVEELVKITGLPITKIKQTLNGLNSDPPEATPEKKKINATGKLNFAPRSFVRPSSDRVIYAATWESSYNDLINNIRQGKGNPEELNKDFVTNTYTRLNQAARNGYGEDYYNSPAGRKMRNNILTFSATKTHVQQRELLGLSRSIKDNNAFREEAYKYLDMQNGNYLDVQAAWAARSAQSARQWGEFQRDKDIYPRLKFRTMGDGDVRPAHALLDGIVKDIDDPFVDRHAPPLDFGCRCWWEQTREPESKETPVIEIDPQFSGNPGRTGEIFNDKNSYNQKVKDGGTRLNIRSQAEALKRELPYNQEIKEGRNKIYVSDFANPDGLENKISASRTIARELKKDVSIPAHIDGGLVEGIKNPGLAIGKKSIPAELKTYSGKSKFDNFVENSIKRANAQGAEFVVLDVTQENNFIPVLSRKLPGVLNNRNKNVKRVIVISGDRAAELTRNEILKRDFKGLEGLKETRQ